MCEKDRKRPESADSDCGTERISLPGSRIVIAGTGSGCGKTTVTSGLLQCLKDRGVSAAAFKCGPDYIDPMFHEKVLGTKSENLDLFFSGREALRYLAADSGRGCDIGVAEGVMGFYDGVGMTETASTYEVAKALDAPVILVLSAAGMASSVLAVLEGFLNHRSDSGIRGVIFNRLPAKLYDRLADRVRHLGIEPLGYLPADGRAEIGSRHLGLITAGEITDLKEKMKVIARWMEKTVDIDGVLRLASEAKPASAEIPLQIVSAEKRAKERRNFARIAVASDEAFCFTYKSNLSLLERLGAELVPFSPLRDRRLPADVDGLLLSGGYPELYAEQLESNKDMRSQIRGAVRRNMPTLAECGGFLYLHTFIEAAENAVKDDAGQKKGTVQRTAASRRKKMCEMADVIPGECRRKGLSGQFGYIIMEARKDGLIASEGERLRAHEFHYWQSSSPGEDFSAEKADRSREWKCGYSSETLYAGFPHLFLYSSPKAAERFVNRCAEFRRGRKAEEERS